MGKALPAAKREPRGLEDVETKAKEGAEAKSIEVRNPVEDSRAPVRLSMQEGEPIRSNESAPAEGLDPELEDVIQGYLKAVESDSPSANNKPEMEPLSVRNRSPEGLSASLERPKSPPRSLERQLPVGFSPKSQFAKQYNTTQAYERHTKYLQGSHS